MAEITADDAKRMSCATLTKLKLFHLVEADRGEPCGYCQGSIKHGWGDCSRCSEKAAPPPVQRSRRKEKEQPPKQSLKRNPVCKTSPILATVDGAVRVYGSGYGGGPLRERQGYATPQLERRTPLVLRLLDKSGKHAVAERSIVCMTGWEAVAKDWERHLGVFGFDPQADEQVYSIRGCTIANHIPVTPRVRANLFEYSPDALVALASKNGLIDEQSVLCDCFTILAGGVVALVHNPEAQKDYCETLVEIVGDLFRKDLDIVTVPTDLLALAQPVELFEIQRSLLEGHLETLSSFCDAVDVRLPISSVVSVIPSGGSRAAEIYAAASGTDRKGVFMVTGAREVAGRSLCLELDEHGFLRALLVLTRHTKKETSLTTEEMFQHVVHAFTPDSGAILNEHMLFDVGGGLRPAKIRDMAVTAYCYGEEWCNALVGAGTCSSSVRAQAAVHFRLASSLEDVTPQNQEQAEELILERPECKFMVEGLRVGHAAALKSLGLTVSEPNGHKGRFEAVVWRPIGGDWSEPCESCFAAAVDMGLCKLADGSHCRAARVVGALRRKVEESGQLYRDAVKKFEVKGANDDDDEEEAFEVPELGSRRMRGAVVAWTGAVQELSGRGKTGGGGRKVGKRGHTPGTGDFLTGYVQPTGSGRGGRGRGRDRDDGGDGQPPPPPPPPGPAPAPAPRPKKKKRKNTSGRHCS